MGYLQTSVVLERLSAEAADRLADCLTEAGAIAVDFADANEGTAAEAPLFGEPGMADADASDWPILRVNALYPDSASDAQIRTRHALASLGYDAALITCTAIADTDWVRVTQALYEPICVSSRLAIVPTWHDPLDNVINLRLDPGVAFGTGSHPTTRLCLQWLDDHVQPTMRVLDYGTGSGILAIAALLLGAAEACGVDIDPQAVEAAQYNATLNAVSPRFSGTEAVPDLDPDILIANILTKPLIMLEPLFARLVQPGRRLALTGILAEQAVEVTDAYTAHFDLAPWRQSEGWTLLTGIRHDRGME